ncbi:hypothetical protein HPB47_012610 [Ixodes persulcatus]|uniref:Uncharacterized protein n=1 Tax=Ixodes persulcatus TaxID=34615 RepID=A0AC60NT27_IXOPE|nr:hypothetical protein HPB47_012610 [Ixodes persulcatus]
MGGTTGQRRARRPLEDKCGRSLGRPPPSINHRPGVVDSALASGPLLGDNERMSRRLDEHQPGLNSSSSGSVFPGRNHSSGPGGFHRPGSGAFGASSASGGASGGAAAGPRPSAKPPSQRQPLALLQDSIHSGGASLDVRDAMQGAGVQFSVTSGFQPRIASGGLSQLGHNHNPSPVHHSMGGQAHTPQIHGQQQFQRLKVEDALSYLDQVKFRFGNQPQVYNDFLDIMKEFKSQSIDTPGVIQRVSNLFKGHPELIVGFNTFLPPGYRIEVQANEQVNVSMPGSLSTTITAGGITLATTTSVAGPSAPGATPSPVGPNAAPPPAPAASSPPSGTKPGHLGGGGPGGPVGQGTPGSQTGPHGSPSSQGGFSQGGTNQTPHGGAPPNSSASQASQPVEFNHAINYVNKIKNRFQGQPDIYKQFLEILHTYQKEQRNLKETGGKPLTESEVTHGLDFGFQPVKAVSNDHTAAAKKPGSGLSKPSLVSGLGSSLKQGSTPLKRPLSHLSGSVTKKQKMTSLKDVTLAEAGKHGTLNEFAFFDKAAQPVCRVYGSCVQPAPLLMAPPKPARKCLTLEQKVKLIRKLEKGGRPKLEIAKEFNIPASTLSTILKNKQDVPGGFQKSFSSKRKRFRGSKYPEVETALLEWLKNARAANLPVHGPALTAKAEALALQMNKPEFNCSYRWLERFKKRHVCQDTVDMWRRHRLAEILEQYMDRDIYNLDEAAFFYKILPKRTYTTADAEIVDLVCGQGEEEEPSDEEPREVPTTGETRNMLRLLRNKVECCGGDDSLMRCLRQLEEAFLMPGKNARQTDIPSFFMPQ